MLYIPALSFADICALDNCFFILPELLTDQVTIHPSPPVARPLNSFWLYYPLALLPVHSTILSSPNSSTSPKYPPPPNLHLPPQYTVLCCYHQTSQCYQPKVCPQSLPIHTNLNLYSSSPDILPKTALATVTLSLSPVPDALHQTLLYYTVLKPLHSSCKTLLNSVLPVRPYQTLPYRTAVVKPPHSSDQTLRQNSALPYCCCRTSPQFWPDSQTKLCPTVLLLSNLPTVLTRPYQNSALPYCCSQTSPQFWPDPTKTLPYHTAVVKPPHSSDQTLRQNSARPYCCQPSPQFSQDSLPKLCPTVLLSTLPPVFTRLSAKTLPYRTAVNPPPSFHKTLCQNSALLYCCCQPSPNFHQTLCPNSVLPYCSCQTSPQFLTRFSPLKTLALLSFWPASVLPAATWCWTPVPVARRCLLLTSAGCPAWHAGAPPISASHSPSPAWPGRSRQGVACKSTAKTASKTQRALGMTGLHNKRSMLIGIASWYSS